MRYIVSSDITGLDIGRARTLSEAAAMAAAYDTPARKAAHTRRKAGTDKLAGQKAAATRAARAKAAKGRAVKAARSAR
jgi:hypothetical protein